jgi:uncharacterized protein (TIGR03492 family)
MSAILFVTNGHGEAAIAERISLEVGALLPGAELDHLALVGEGSPNALRDVGPRRRMPSGGLIAMGNVRNLAADLRAGLLPLTLAQAAFLRRARSEYVVTVAVGDVYALIMTLLARLPTVFVGSAKSVAVAPYGPFEERMLARATVRFVRDEPTAGALRRHGVEAGVANAIVDLIASVRESGADEALADFNPALALFPGSRDAAYEDAEFLLGVVAELSATRPTLGAALSIARGLEAGRFADLARRTGWEVRATASDAIPFVLQREGRDVVRAWRGTLGPLLARVALVLGQAGTANEAAAAAGVPIVAFERDRDRKSSWYRQRQRGLLGEALVVLPGRLSVAVTGVGAILDDPAQRGRMSQTGRLRMGPAGGARRIAERIAALATST